MSKAQHREKPRLSGLKKRNYNASTNAYLKTKSINGLKSKIRDTERLLSHANDLPADIRVEKERALASYRQDVEQIARDKARSKMISRYHKVRFFERQKATRILKKLTRTLNEAQHEDDKTRNLRLALMNAQIDLNYTIYCPLTEKYQSLYVDVRKDASEENEDSSMDIKALSRSDESRPQMWQVVKACSEEGTLELLRDGKLKSRYAPQDAIGSASVSNQTKFASREELPKKGALMQTEPKPDQDVDSDDAFFE